MVKRNVDQVASPFYGCKTMFKKPLAHRSNATPLRSSARRQLLSAIFAQYPILLEGVSEENGLSEKDLGKLILPEGIRTGTFETSGGVEGVCYSHLLFHHLTDNVDVLVDY
jgi:hypothetical protein